MKKLSIKSTSEIAIMTEGGHKLGEIKKQLAAAAKVGMTTLELDKLADQLIKKAGAEASFKKVPGYSWATCINVNDIVVHGIPNHYRLKNGDKVGIDVGLYYQGYHTDTSTTVIVGNKKNPALEKFLEVGRQALKKAIKQAKPGNRIADLSLAMESTVEASGYSPVQALTGHGIGKNLHEEPAIPCFTVGQYKHSPKIEVGMVLAIEIMYNQGSSEVIYKNDDGWTIATADGKISGLFEDTVAVSQNGPVVLTQ